MNWKDILKTHCNEKADKEKQIFEKDLEDLSGDGEVTRKDFLIGAGVLDKDGKKVKKANPEKMILDEIKQEGGALGMKDLKDLKGISNLKETLDRLVKEGKIYIHHGDGDIISIKKPSKGRGFTA
jgi:hypothetical protein